MRIDAHHHFWKYNQKEYDWITDDMSVLRRNYLPADLKEEIKAAGIDGVVTVQARQTLEETDWLLEVAAEYDFIKGVVGWVPLVSPDVAEHLKRVAANSKLKGIRHVLQGEPDDLYMLREDFNEGIRKLREFDLVYDILIFERHLPQTIEFVDRHPSQVFVLDHIAKPRVRDKALEPWRTHIVELAQRDNVYCKLSGVVTEAESENWTEDQVQPYMETVLDAFGAERVMFGSDWPVCLVASGYSRWVKTVEQFASRLSLTEQQHLFGATASRAYGLAGRPLRFPLSRACKHG